MAQSKIYTIISHEYIKRIKSKGFILGTLLGPFALLLIIAVPAAITILSMEDTGKQIAVVDKTESISDEIIKTDPAKYFKSSESQSVLKEKVLKNELDGYLYLPEDFLERGKGSVYTKSGGGIGFMNALRSDLSRIVRHKRLIESGASEDVIKMVESGINIETQKITEEGLKKDYSELYAGLGYFLGFLIYGLMFIYGTMVMRGVTEEKANRIVEIIASSAKPFEIMMGKVLGIGFVGLTQVIFWVVLSSIILTAAAAIMGPEIAQSQMASGGMASAEAQAFSAGGFEMPEISPWIGVGFIFYFLAGYFIYSCLFAAVGSAVDQEQDAQQLTLPITLPIIIPILVIFNVMSNPDGTLAVVMSLIPFFSPILMIVRIAATDVPAWQVILSIVLMLGTFLGSLWLAAKIYRVGILMYGKKPSFKDLAKWIRMDS